LRLLPFCHALFARYLAAVSFGRGFYASQLVMGNLGRLRACGGIVVFALSFGAVWGGVMGVITAPVYCYWGGMGKSWAGAKGQNSSTKYISSLFAKVTSGDNVWITSNKNIWIM